MDISLPTEGGVNGVGKLESGRRVETRQAWKRPDHGCSSGQDGGAQLP